MMGGASVLPGGLYAAPHPPSLHKFRQLLHLNQAGASLRDSAGQ